MKLGKKYYSDEAPICDAGLGGGIKIEPLDFFTGVSVKKMAGQIYYHFYVV